MVGINRLQLATSVALLGSASSYQVQMQQPMLASESSSDQLPLGGVAVKRPLVDSKALQASIKSENLLKRAEHLYEIAKLGEKEFNHPTRVIGSDGHLGTLSYIYSTIAKLGDYYTISNQSFPAVTGHVYESRLVLGDKVPESAEPMSLTPPTKGREPVHGDVVLVSHSGCEASDFPKDVKGAIAMVERGTCPFGTKSENAGRAGAIAVIIYNNEEGGVHGTLGQPSPYHVASFGISKAEAEPFLKKLKKGEALDAIAYMDAEVKTTITDNIIAQTVEGDPENCVMLGGHSDSVPEGPGINDDGSGSLTLLEIATQLTKFSVNNCVRFAWWAAEEEGLLGSDFYTRSLTEEENRVIRVFGDYDMLGSPNYALQIYNATNDANPTGSEELRDLFVDWYESHQLNYTFIPFDGRSDYDGFIRAGIPAGGIATGAEGIKTKHETKMFGGKAGDWYDPCYHQLCDDVGNVNMTAWELNSQLVAHFVATYAVSFKGFPERTTVVASEAYDQNTKYHGSKLVI